MTLQSFKDLVGVASVEFAKSTKSDRLVAVNLPGTFSLVTTKDFDPTEDFRVYDNPEGEEGRDYVLSNKLGPSVVLSL